MAKPDKIQMPSGMGGLVRYFDDYKSKIKFQPQHIIILIVVVIILILILHQYGAGWIGL
ncbi:MAG: preprotein translocase subunit Sec61beta [Nanoarchaeota archaeon]|nr:preprotein translocase subunit Sec61beta [Nanoarchaeota archaeon]